MPRRKPQSGAAKKEQLTIKRAQKRGENVDDVSIKKPTIQKFSRSAYLDPKSSKKKKQAAKLESNWNVDDDLLIDQNEVMDGWYWNRPIGKEDCIWNLNESDESPLNCFKRPKWNYKMSKKELESNELMAFKKWLNNTDTVIQSYDNVGTGTVFERNLEVWRQFWRTCEMSQILLILIDIRLPPIHYTNSLKLYLKHLTERQSKRIIYIFTKIDLVPVETIQSWELWLKSQLNSTDQIVKLSSYQVLIGKQGKGKRQPFIDPKSINDLLKCIENAYISLKTRPENLNPNIDWKPTVPDQIDFNNVVNEVLERLRNENEIGIGNKDKNKDDDSDNENDLMIPQSGKAQRRKARKIGRIKAENKKGGGARVGFEGDDDDDDVEQVEKLLPNDQIPQENSKDDDQQQEHDNRTEEDVLSVGILGQPNVGKSSVINGLFGSSKVRASATPGKTKHFQTLYLASKLRLIDCPGLIWPSIVPRWAQVLGSTVPISQEKQPSTILFAIGKRMPLEHLLPLAPQSVLEREEVIDKRTWREGMVRTSSKDNEDNEDDNSSIKVLDIFERYSIRAGFMTAKAGRPDINRSSNYILRQITTSQIKWSFLPLGVELNESHSSNGIFIDITNNNNANDNDSSESDEISSEENENHNYNTGNFVESDEDDNERDDKGIKNIRSAFDILNVDEGDESD